MEKDNKITVISIILAIIAVVIVGFIVYYKTTKPAEKPAEKNEPQNEEKEEVPNSEPEVNYEEIAKDLYKILGNNPEFRYGEKTTYETLSETVRDSIVLNLMQEACSEFTSVPKEQFQEQYKNIFNHEKESEEGYCKLNGDNYECERVCNEHSVKIYKVFDKYEKTDDSIILYENVGHLDYFDDGKVYLQANASDSEAIASFDSLDDLLNSTVTYKLPSYKHVFRKIGDKYYWESSEVNEQ